MKIYIVKWVKKYLSILLHEVEDVNCHYLHD